MQPCMGLHVDHWSETKILQLGYHILGSAKYPALHDSSKAANLEYGSN